MRQLLKSHSAAIVLITGLGAHAWPAAAQSEGLLRAAVDRHQAVSLHNWRFDRVRYVDDVELRERCVGIDYRKADCRLRLVGGEPPDEKALERYAKRVTQPVERNLPNVDVAKYIDFDTLSGGGTQDDVALYTFDRKPDPEDENVAKSEQKGTARVHREEGYVEQLKMESTKVFKPATGVKINGLLLTMDFIEVDDTVFVEQVAANVKGRAFGMKKIDEEEIFRFENFVAPY